MKNIYIKYVLNKYINDIEEKEIEIEKEIIDKSNPNLYINDCKYIYDKSKTLYGGQLDGHIKPIIEPNYTCEEMVSLHKIRDDNQFTIIKDLYEKLVYKCYSDGFSYSQLLAHIHNYSSVTYDKYINFIKIRSEINICEKYSEFKTIEEKLIELGKTYNINNLRLYDIEYISKLKKNSDICWKYDNKIKVYYLKFNEGYNDFRLYLDKSATLLYKSIYKVNNNELIFNKDINTELYNIYLEIKKDKNNNKE